MRVYIGIGHGGSDPGAVGNGFRESDLNLSVGKHCAAYLKKYGVNVKISRTTDSDVWLETRIKQANAFKADLALDIHHNAGGGDGIEVYHSVSGGKSKTLAQNIITEAVKIGQNSRGLRTRTNSSGKDYFGFIRQTSMPAVLVECAFVDSKDIKIVDTETERKKMGEAIANAILKTLGVKKILLCRCPFRHLFPRKKAIQAFSQSFPPADIFSLVTAAPKLFICKSSSFGSATK